jgi:hypothetical protein
MPSPIAGRHHLHQHHYGKDQGDARKRRSPEFADEVGLNQPDRGLSHHHQHVRRR